MLVPLLAAITIHADFPGGNIGQVEQIAPAHFRCAIQGESDQDKRNRQPSWFYFRVDGAAGREVIIDLTGLEGEYNYRPTNARWAPRMRPAWSGDNRNWRTLETVEFLAAATAVRLKLAPKTGSVWLARIPPYTLSHLDALLAEVRRHPHVREETIGASAGGRPLRLLTITNPATPAESKKVVWLMARQHAWEAGTSWVAEGAMRFLIAETPEARRIRDRVIYKVFPLCDPDGVERGGVRFNVHGYDLNRNWDAVDPKLMPEIHAQRRAVLAWVDAGRPIHLFLTLHNTESADFIEGPLTVGGAPVREMAARLDRLLAGRTAFHSPNGPRDAPAATTAGRKGRMTVTQGLFHERKIPAFLMELMVEPSPKLGREPSVSDRLGFGRALAQVLADALE